MLKEAVYGQIKEMADDGSTVIYEKHEVNERLNLETYVVILKINSYVFRIYQSMLHSTGTITTKFVSIDEDMFNAMKDMYIKK